MSRPRFRLRVPERELERIRRRALAAYPEECCGLLLGTAGATGAEVREAVAADNHWPGDRRRRYEIAPETLLEVHKSARVRGLEVVGYFHSHPDGAAVPSAFDRRRAWPDTTYLIVAADGREVTEARSWRLDDRGGGFVEAELR